MEVVFPDIPVPMTGFPEPGLLIVRGYEVGGLTMVVAVARGMLVPVNNGVLVLAGGLDVVKTVTLFITARLTFGPPAAFGTASKGLLIFGPLMDVAVVTGLPRIATPPVDLGGAKLGLGTVGILRG